MLGVVVVVVVVGSWEVRPLKKGTYTYVPKTWSLGLLQFWRLKALFITILGLNVIFNCRRRRFLLIVLAPKALFIVSFGAEGALYLYFYPCLG